MQPLKSQTVQLCSATCMDLSPKDCIYYKGHDMPGMVKALELRF